MKMATKWMLALVGAVLLASGASAERRWIVAGELDTSDRTASTVTVEGHTLSMTSGSAVKDEDGSSGDWEDIEGREGDYVSVLVSTGYPHPVVETIVLQDEEEDGE